MTEGKTTGVDCYRCVIIDIAKPRNDILLEGASSDILYLSCPDTSPKLVESSILRPLRSAPVPDLSLSEIHVHVSADNQKCFEITFLASLVPFLRRENSATLSLFIHVPFQKKFHMKTYISAIQLAGLNFVGESVRSEGDDYIRTLTGRRRPLAVASGSVLRLGSTLRLPVTKNVVSDNDDEDDLLDESDLLAASESPPVAPLGAVGSSKDDCAGRKPCDNCSCGRAEAERAGLDPASVVMTPAIQSACGNCGKGDAFRCAGCPHLGKPAFKSGEESLVLEMVDDF
uniref:Anamorsin C-terminal domain-containing protein n=1 Tax=Corethron hystrix TaxID=216773 RepID=A0A7S1FUA3_9STRA|mmetsp:Transcript_32527/g.74844  ORF Transcript_32527/g.74844 Transcript_32527/m.74844 type:complete len:286 (+) Transcript_32527:81-938(+)|eukprot:CAMPEP_0113309784 /NCGR_PEP_ID=MMETSP0010_2-20120614/7686_1 /TAXON_ID=216773 ORGANISM="Corethron hystrix, Strain 308" /NCGR_SAMPLE_ID=MMETSP0010_2 /ASSEMBLY_ACC=CAM_ASM_000155 /LENGTH=285 /DNA_ID=CAMNT_0000165099 /DNA_START=43 /DNA_END=900 /DNA_ORIENTATION=+ /assembly_acc=CAM_ASM_000155